MIMRDRYHGKRLLILGGAVQHLKVVRAAKELGVYTIVTDIVRDSETKRAADLSLPYSVMDADALIAWCKAHPVDGVLNFCIDFAQRSHQKICGELGSPCYGTSEQYGIFTDKRRFKEACRENGVDVIEAYSESRLDEIRYPVIVKPAESSGSRGSVICYQKADLMNAIDRAKNASRNGDIVIERYMPSPVDLEVTYLVIDGEPRPAYLGDRYLGERKDGLDKVCVAYAGPSKCIEKYLKGSHRKICDMIRRIGIKNGPVVLQGIWDGDIVRFYDAGMRFAGDEFASIVKAATGVDYMSCLVKYALSGSMDLTEGQMSNVYGLNGHNGCILLFAAGAGTISRMDGLDEIRRMPATVSAVQKKFVGETIVPENAISGRRICEVAVMADGGIENLQKSIRSVEKRLCVEDENGNDMLVSVFDPDLLL